MEIKRIIEKETIEKRIKDLALQIENDFKGEELLILPVLTGALMFASDLCKNISNKMKIEVLKISSYIKTESAELKDIFGLDVNIENKNIVIVEDIVDTGKTMHYLKELLMKQNPKNIKICTLIDKPEKRVEKIEADYKGFVLHSKFIIGYGMDYDGYYRNLPYIGEIIE